MKITIEFLRNLFDQTCIHNGFINKKREMIKPYIKTLKLFKDKIGLEVGGPSSAFRKRRFIPLYSIIKNLDGCNFSNSTLWEGKIEDGLNYKYTKNKIGHQYISDGTNLSMIPNEKYDFVISSNCLEHIANPLKAVEEWIRVIKKRRSLAFNSAKKRALF